VRIQRTTAASVMPSGEERLGFWEGRRRLPRLRRAGADWERSRRGGASAACGRVCYGLRGDGTHWSPGRSYLPRCRSGGADGRGTRGTCGPSTGTAAPAWATTARREDVDGCGSDGG
jgi:hypothetical protein